MCKIRSGGKDLKASGAILGLMVIGLLDSTRHTWPASVKPIVITAVHRVIIKPFLRPDIRNLGLVFAMSVNMVS